MVYFQLRFYRVSLVPVTIKLLWCSWWGAPWGYFQLWSRILATIKSYSCAHVTRDNFSWFYLDEYWDKYFRLKYYWSRQISRHLLHITYCSILCLFNLYLYLTSNNVVSISKYNELYWKNKTIVGIKYWLKIQRRREQSWFIIIYF